MPVNSCLWSEEADGNWDTRCGDTFILSHGTPLDNGLCFCCYCGLPLEQKLFSEEEE